MKNTKISIICPVFNAEEYLDRCINSIIDQTLTEWELILVNDGSTDNSGLICEKYSSQDHRIKVISKTNGGVGEARQVGLDNSSGDYIIHVDPDDWIEPNMLEDMYEKAESESADMVMCDFIYEYCKRNEVIHQKPTNVNDCDSLVNDMLTHRLHGSCCNKLVKKKTCDEYAVNFVSGLNYCEDVIFNIKLLKRNIKVAYMSEALYHYDQNTNQSSLTRTTSYETFLQRKKYYETLISVYSINEEVDKTLKINIKKMALLNELLNAKQIKQLYPECCFVKSRFFLDTIFYYIGFKGYLDIVKPYFKLRSKLLAL